MGLPSQGLEGVAVALLEAIPRRRLGGDLFQHLRLPSLVDDLGEEPKIVSVGLGVFGGRQEVAYGQARAVATPFSALSLSAVPLQGPLTELGTPAAIMKACRVVIVLDIEQRVS